MSRGHVTLAVEAVSLAQVVMQFEPRHSIGPERMAQRGGWVAVARLWIDASSSDGDEIGQRVEVDGQRRAAIFASIAMDCFGTIEGLKITTLGPAKASLGKIERVTKAAPCSRRHTEQWQ